MMTEKKEQQIEIPSTSSVNEGWIVISPSGKLKTISENQKKIKQKNNKNENSRKRKFN